MTDIQSTAVDGRIRATTSAVSLTVSTGVVDTSSDDELLAHAKTLVGALIAQPDSTNVSTKTDEGIITLQTGEQFEQIALGDVHDTLDDLVAAVVETYFHLELDAEAPDHYSGDEPDRVLQEAQR